MKFEAGSAGGWIVSMQAVEVEFGAGQAASLESRSSAVSWAAIAAGAVAISALTLVLLAFGAGMGFMAVSPWSSSPPSTTFGIVAGIYLLVVATLSSTIGGYLAGRLRSKWVDVHTHEVYFRDTAHGFLAWAFAAVISAAVLTSAATTIASPVRWRRVPAPPRRRSAAVVPKLISSICCCVPSMPRPPATRPPYVERSDASSKPRLSGI